jgi:hypothetical protein
MLGVHGPDAAATLARRFLQQPAGHHHRLLVGDRDRLAAQESLHHGLKPFLAHDAGNDDVHVVSAGNLANARNAHVIADTASQCVTVRTGDEAGSEFVDLLREQISVVPGAKAYDLEALRMGANNVEGLTTDRPGRAQHGDTSQRTIHY